MQFKEMGGVQSSLQGRSREICVIGAGVSGLRAAWLLLAAGWTICFRKISSIYFFSPLLPKFKTSLIQFPWWYPLNRSPNGDDSNSRDPGTANRPTEQLESPSECFVLSDVQELVKAVMDMQMPSGHASKCTCSHSS
jgi:hypothetical protein